MILSITTLKKILHPYRIFLNWFYGSSIVINAREQIINELSETLSGMKSVLDIGCGDNSPLGEVPKDFFSEGLDFFEDYIITSKQEEIHDRYKVANAKDLIRLYPPKSFDAIIGLDIIEHLTKEDGLRLIADMEIIARKKIIILTPNGLLPQRPSPENKGQEHISGWTKKELQSLGFKCKGLNGLKTLKGEHGLPRFKPLFMWEMISDATHVILKHLPANLSFELFCVKELEKNPKNSIL